jgi:YHS domain-containing protein
MPIIKSKDKKGKFYKYGKTGKKYYYCNEKERKKAMQKAIKQGYAIEQNKKRNKIF